ncbi:hypothetical protein ASPFODRAFT_55267 [Aspergillus luchuensis CBS 106.47]|uniref:Uncharacterized protein n=1 Tax=Aspergillus luchuensis (strain CBS 106.47) TaxID=1137211 RepID=A0A1M3TXN7_ASPLC|nr:hypothetical protein ASPFODRAFT_55267 [Aspergillus luchuensis CBS 106.47]GAA92987.1 similar to An02g00700 [Aspergillus luchuensis IFO 4308]
MPRNIETPGGTKTPETTKMPPITDVPDEHGTPANAEAREELEMPEDTEISIPRTARQELDDQLHPLYSYDFLTRDQYQARVRSAERLLNTGSEGWDMEPPQIRQRYQRLRIRLTSWILYFVNNDVGSLPSAKTNLIIASLEGYCVKKDWTILQEQLPATVHKRLGTLFAEALINKFIMEKIFSNPFWYLDGKLDLADQGEDECFPTKLHYLYQRFFKSESYFLTQRLQPSGNNKRTDWLIRQRMSTQMATISFGQENANRLTARAPFLVDEILASEPLSLLLRGPLTKDEALEQRNHLISIFEQASTVMLTCEAYLGGHFAIQLLPELGPLYDCESDYMTFLDYDPESSSDKSTMDGPSDYDSISTIVEKATVVLAEQTSTNEKAKGLEGDPGIEAADNDEGRVDPEALKQTHLGNTASGRGHVMVIKAWE